jgi:hypothetical protein
MKVRVNDEIQVRVGFSKPTYRIGVVIGIEQIAGADVIDYRTDDGRSFWCYPSQVVSHCGPNV